MVTTATVLRGMDSFEREAREVAEVRWELRHRLMAQFLDGVHELLARLRRVAERKTAAGDPDAAELRAELERWRVRFELLSNM
jgi:hypothetical protein